MQKIMFDDDFHLTRAVQEGWKNMTRRIAKSEKPRYKVGEIVAVAQKYKDIMPYLADSFRQPSPNYMMDKPGYNNKMYVRADLMPTRIRIIAWRRERLQEISDEDCLREGIIEYAPCSECGSDLYSFYGATDVYYSPREAFADLIRKMSGKRAWDDNPYVDVYEYELVKCII